MTTTDCVEKSSIRGLHTTPSFCKDNGVASPKSFHGACYCISEVPPMTPQSPSEMVGTWIIAQVLSHHEKTVAGMLAQAGVQHYLPLYGVTDNRRRHREIPLFGGYVFVCCRHDDDRYELSQRYTTAGQKIVYGVIEVNNQKRLVGELSNLHMAVQAGDVRPYRLPVKGDHCEIVAGPWRGIRGKIVHAGKQDKFVIEIQTLGRAVECQVPPQYLEIID